MKTIDSRKPWLAVLFILGAVFAWPAMSQDGSAAGNRQPPAPEQVVDLMDAKLGLNASQKSRLTPIIAERQQQLLAIRSDTSLGQYQKLRKAKAVFADSDQKINALLTDNQRQQYAQFEQDIRQQLQEHMKDRQANAPQ